MGACCGSPSRTPEEQKAEERKIAKAYHPHAFVSVYSVMVHPAATPLWCIFFAFCATILFCTIVCTLFPLVGLFWFFVFWKANPSFLLRRVGLKEQENSQATFTALLGDQSVVYSARGRASGNTALGVFHMRGNRMGDGFFCMDRGYWESPDKAWVSGYADNVWMNKKSFYGWCNFALAKFFGLRLVYTFGENTKFKFVDKPRREATIKATIFSLRNEGRVYGFTLPSFLIQMGMTDVSENKDGTLWERWTYLFGVRMRSYFLEQVAVTSSQAVVDESGATSWVNHQASEGKYWPTVQGEAPKTGLCFPGKDWRRPDSSPDPSDRPKGCSDCCYRRRAKDQGPEAPSAAPEEAGAKSPGGMEAPGPAPAASAQGA